MRIHTNIRIWTTLRPYNLTLVTRLYMDDQHSSSPIIIPYSITVYIPIFAWGYIQTFASRRPYDCTTLHSLHFYIWTINTLAAWSLSPIQSPCIYLYLHEDTYIHSHLDDRTTLHSLHFYIWTIDTLAARSLSPVQSPCIYLYLHEDTYIHSHLDDLTTVRPYTRYTFIYGRSTP